MPYYCFNANSTENTGKEAVQLCLNRLKELRSTSLRISNKEEFENALAELLKNRESFEPGVCQLLERQLLEEFKMSF